MIKHVSALLHSLCTFMRIKKNVLKYKVKIFYEGKNFGFIGRNTYCMQELAPHLEIDFRKDKAKSTITYVKETLNFKIRIILK